ncbi:MAG: DUF362 domain-containing protein [Deltaproteobacteria bacterium]|nr:DUF362 domain-containing protein [Deltaproteobacteria bacterium]
MKDQWNRRRFITRLGVSSAGILGASTIGLLAKDRGRHEPPDTRRMGHVRDFRSNLGGAMPSLVISRGDPSAATRGAVEELGGIERFVRPGDTVVIKPNVGWDRTPIQAANTNPLVIGALVSLCRTAKASRIVVTDNTCNEARRCFTRSGIWKAVEDAGGEVILPAPHRFKPYDLGGIVLGRMPVLVPAVRADRFINVPVAKHHGLSGFTGGMKNLYGVLGGRRNRLHQNIDVSIADLAHFIRPTLTVMDATRVLLRNGPQGGDVADTLAIGEVIASEDPVAVDAYACGLINLAPGDLPYLAIAEQRGIGTADLTRIERREVS